MTIIVLLIVLGNIIGVIMVAYGLTANHSRITGILIALVGLGILVGDWQLSLAFVEGLKQ